MVRLNKIKLLYTVIKLINFFYKNNQMPQEYIWYCPRQACNAIITKTKDPILPDKPHFCKHCKTTFSMSEVVSGNKRNLTKYFNGLNKEIS